MSERAEDRPREVREPEAGRADTRVIAEIARILQRRRLERRTGVRRVRDR